jgi:hypothetical protein
MATCGESMGFLRKSGSAREAPLDEFAAVVDRMRRAGADPRMRHETRHFIYVPGVKSAQQLAKKLAGRDRRVTIETSARKGYWLVVVTEAIVVSPDHIGALRAEFEAAAGPFGGEYDRWQVDIAVT